MGEISKPLAIIVFVRGKDFIFHDRSRILLLASSIMIAIVAFIPQNAQATTSSYVFMPSTPNQKSISQQLQ